MNNNEILDILFDYLVESHNVVIQSRSTVLEKKTSSIYKQKANSYYYSIKNQIAWLEQDNHNKVHGDPNDNYTFKGRTEKINQIPYDQLQELFETTNFEGFSTAHQFRTEVLVENGQDIIELTKELNYLESLYKKTGWDLPNKTSKTKASKKSQVKVLEHNSQRFQEIQARLKQSGIITK